jgi:hypothetical protein
MYVEQPQPLEDVGVALPVQYHLHGVKREEECSEMSGGVEG